MISIDALILLGCFQCAGTDTEKAEVFVRVVTPEMQKYIMVSDSDLTTALHFMISLATVLEEMTREMMRNPTLGINFHFYQLKIKKYRPTYDGMIEDFNDNVFGEYSNKVAIEDFVASLSHYGWKYFDFVNLNQLFALMYQKFGATEVIDTDLPQFPELTLTGLANSYAGFDGLDSTRAEPASKRTDLKDLD